MRAKRGKSLLIAGGIVALIVIAAIAALLLFDINKFKSNIESAAFDATGLDVRIHGKIGLSFSPFGVSAKNIHVANKGGEILSLENLKLRLELMSLLKKQLEVTSCELFKPAITIVKDTEGRYNFETPEKKSTKWLLKATARLNELKLYKGMLVYLDKKTDKKTELKDFNLAIKDLSIGNTPGDIINNASFTGSVDCKEAVQNDFRIENLKASVKAVKGIYNFQPLVIGSLAYIDRKSGEKTGLKEINLTVKDLSVADTSGDLIKNVSFTGKIDCKELLQKNLRIENLKASVKAVKGIYNFQPLAIGSLAYFDRKSGEKTGLKEINLTIEDLSVADTSGDLIKNVSFTGNMDCKEGQQKNLRIEHLKASVKAVKGIYNFQSLVIRSLVYFDRKAGEKTELKEINLAIKDLSVTDTSGEIIKNVSFTGNMDCKEMRKKNLRVDNVKSSIKVEKAVFYLKPLTMDIFGGKGEGDATADKSEVHAVYKINLKITKLDFEKLQKSYGAKRVIGGKGDLFASLMMKEKGSRNLLSGIDGTLSLRGDNLVMYTMDLDKVLSSYETTQEFNLVDLGAFFIAGPLGTVALRGYHYGDLYSQTRGGQGVITHFISHWKIKGGVADAKDCAFATQHNRVALKGKLDLVGEQYDNVIVALLDDKGCAKFKQSISGPFDRPQISTVSAVESLAGPFLNLYRKAKRFVQGGKCEVFYYGAVHQPR